MKSKIRKNVFIIITCFVFLTASMVSCTNSSKNSSNQSQTSQNSDENNNGSDISGSDEQSSQIPGDSTGPDSSGTSVVDSTGTSTGTSTGISTGTSTGTSTGNSSSAGTTKLALQKLASGFEIPTKAAINLKSKKVVYMQTANGPDYKPGGMYYEGILRNYGIVTEHVYSPAADLATNLNIRVQSGESPDVVDVEGNFPTFNIQGLVQKVDGLIDYSVPIMQNLKSVYDQYMVGNNHYALVNYSYATSAVYYNKKIFDDNDMDTPLTLYKKGKWNWDTFKSAAKELTLDANKDGKPERYGLFMTHWQSTRLVFTTGQNIVKYQNGKFVNNLNNTAFNRAFDFLYSLAYVDKVAFPNRDVSATYSAFEAGKSAMLMTAGWSGTNQYTFKILKNQGILEYAPYPKDPQSSTYKVPGTAIALFVPVGTTNYDAIKAFIYSTAAGYREANKPGNATYDENFAKTKAEMPNMTEAYFKYLAGQYEINNNMATTQDIYRGILDVETIYTEMIGGGSDGVAKSFQKAIEVVNPLLNQNLDGFNAKQ